MGAGGRGGMHFSGVGMLVSSRMGQLRSGWVVRADARSKDIDVWA